MLVLRRRPNQAVTIGDDVRVVVLAVEGDAVRLGIEAPATVPVRRAEAKQKSALSD
ncbi:MAG: carbon storage regulator [Candidatus Eremiobacteraeota bacterium]|nr:carbon storage regulator [Candidatus Eremiobacteraeota bacterium]